MIKNKFWSFAFRHAERYRDAIKLIRFARNMHEMHQYPPSEFALELLEKKVVVSLREGTTDVGTFAEVFRDHIYELPAGFNPKVILDIGGNIGMASLYFALRYPDAEIHTFEPISQNVAIMERNITTNQLRNVTIHAYGLGKRDEVITFSAPSAGAFWGYTAGGKSQGLPSIQAPIRNIESVFEELKLSRVDLAKVDCEGAELDLFRCLGDRLAQIEILFGEMHPYSCNVHEALYLLSRSHQVDYEKQFDQIAFTFRASHRPWKDYVIG